MKLYDGGRAPNPRRVRIFLAEKGMSVPLEAVDLATLQHKTPAYTAVNPLQQLPALALDDGTVLTESIAICRYFEMLQPEPRLFGREGLEAVRVEMWNRRIESLLFWPVMQAFRHPHPAMKALEVPQVPAWGEANKPRALDFLTLLDRELADRPFVAGETFTIADITGLVALDFTKPARIAIPESLVHVRRWHAVLAGRPSAAA
jgi:glutathione S-transferase